MVKNGTLIIIASLLVLSCSTKEIKTKKIEEIATLIWQCDTKALTDQPSGYLDLKSYKDSLIFITEAYNRHLIKFDRFTGKYVVVGRQGNGPGEYRNPFSILVEKDELVINDLNAQRIQKIDLEGKYIKEFSFKKMVNGTRMTLVNDSTIYLLNNGSRVDHFVINNHNESFIKVPKCFSTMPYPLAGTGGIVKYSNTLYVMNPYEWKIYKIDLSTKNETVVNLNGGDNFFQWEPYYERSIKKEEENILLETKFAFRPDKLFCLTINSRLYFLLTGSDRSNSDVYKNICHLFDSSGELLFTIDAKDLILFESMNGKLLFYEYDKDNYGIKHIYCYKINQDLKL